MLEKMGSLEKEICIKCDKGGEVLACADSCCPIAVHVRCMGVPARFDGLGKFYCPYCLYRKSVANVRRARENVLSKKQALHTFIDKKMIGSDKEVPSVVSKSTCERADEPLPEKRSDLPQNNCGVGGQQIHSGPVDTSKATATDSRVLETGNRVQVNDLQQVGKHQLEKSVEDHHQWVVGQQIHSGLVDTSKATTTDCRVLETGNRVQVNDLQQVGEHQLEKSVEDHHQDVLLSNSCVAEEKKLQNGPILAETIRKNVDIAREQKKEVDETTATFTNAVPPLQQHLKCKRRVETGYSTCSESKPVSTQRKCSEEVKKAGIEHVVSKPPRRLTRNSASSLENSNVAGKLVQVKQPSMLPVEFPNMKRKAIPWRREEEEMIEGGNN